MRLSLSVGLPHIFSCSNLTQRIKLNEYCIHCLISPSLQPHFVIIRMLLTFSMSDNSLCRSSFILKSVRLIQSRICMCLCVRIATHFWALSIYRNKLLVPDSLIRSSDVSCNNFYGNPGQSPPFAQLFWCRNGHFCEFYPHCSR